LWHWGHRLRAGALRVQALARRLRLLAFDVFFLGTAMEAELSVSGWGLISIAGRHCSVAARSRGLARRATHPV
jgi:hypothetical protein